MESGIGWTNLNIAFSSVDPNGYYIAAMRAVVDSGGLARFAQSAAERLFLKSNNVSTLFVPVFLPEPDGYNGGNRLTCLCCFFLLLSIFIYISIFISLRAVEKSDFDRIISLTATNDY